MSEPGPAGASDLLRRSFHYRDLAAGGARFRQIGDAMVVADYQGPDEVEQARKLALADLSPLPRFGCKGPRMVEWLKSKSIVLGQDSNRAYPAPGGLLAARLAPTEVLLLGGLDGDAEPIDALQRAWSYDVAGVWPVPRRDASFWFAVTGVKAPAMFAKICGVDLRPKSFADHSVAQTSVARTNCIIIRDDLGDVPAYALLGDSASASFMWHSVLDAMSEFGGAPVGLDPLQQLAGR